MEGPSTDVSPGVGRDRPFRFDTPSFERLLRRIRQAGRSFVDFTEPEGGVVLHHDVELSLERALAMARLEATLRIRGTYCVPLDAPLHGSSTVEFARTVRTISKLGHEVGLQFDPNGYWETPPSEAALRQRIDDRRAVLARLVGEPIEVVSFRDPTDRCRSLELNDAVNTRRYRCADPAFRCISDREWQDRTPLPDGVPERFRLHVHPGLWHPVDRNESDVVESYRRAAHERVEAYFDAFTTSPPAD